MSFILLGILNSQAAGAVGEGDYDLLETEILASSQSSVTFTGLGSYTDYKHLQIRAVARTTTQNDPSRSLSIQVNGDSGTNYVSHRLFGNGSSVSSAAYTSRPDVFIANIAGASAASNDFGAAVIDILDFSSSSKNTTFRALDGILSRPFVDLMSGLYNNTSAVTSLEIFAGGDSLASGSRFSLYGIRG